MDLNIGQTYKIKVQMETINEGSIFVDKHAKLLQETKFFLVFEYKTKSGDLTRTTIDKFDLKNNPKLIMEA